jgi:DNA processing protein
VDKTVFYISLSIARGLGSKTVKKLLDMYEDPEFIFHTSVKELSEIIGPKRAEYLLREKDTLIEKSKRIFEKAVRKDIKVVHLKNREYPQLLKEIPDPPAVLYVKGNLSFMDRSISVVGSRRFSLYGKSTTYRFVKELSGENINIVSGLALGIDTIAHKSALDNGGFTTAVLGCGVDIVYPYENRGLYERILERGCLISEYPPETKPSKYTFPKRNRIIAGLSYGTVVTEAPEKSGALITAKLANDYGRVVFAVPTNINNPYGKGCNILIKEGAVPLLSADDIKQEIPFLFNQDKEQKDIELSNIEREILEVLTEPRHIDTIIQKTGYSFREISLILFDMEMKGLIECSQGMYIRK